MKAVSTPFLLRWLVLNLLQLGIYNQPRNTLKTLKSNTRNIEFRFVFVFFAVSPTRSVTSAPLRAWPLVRKLAVAVIQVNIAKKQLYMSGHACASKSEN